MPERWTRAVLRYRLIVLACWLLVLVLGALAAPRLSPLLSNSLAVPGTGSEAAQTILAAPLRTSAPTEPSPSYSWSGHPPSAR